MLGCGATPERVAWRERTRRSSSSVRNRTYLLTGGAGFIGSHLAERLLARGDAVVVLDDLSTGRRGNLDAVAGNPRLTIVQGTVLDADLVGSLAGRCDEVVHLAAVVGVQLVLREPVRTLETNVRGTDVVVTAAARHGRPLLVASSSEVYGRGASVPFREDDPVLHFDGTLAPRDDSRRHGSRERRPAPFRLAGFARNGIHGSPERTRWVYAASKLTTEHLALARHREEGLPVRVARLFNTAGPRQVGDYGMVLPRFVEQALAGGPVTVHGDGHQTRAFIHVQDTAEALVRLLDAPGAVGRPVNVGAAGEVSILELARRVVAHVAERTGTHAQIVHLPLADAYGPGFDEPGRRAPDVSRLREITGFTATRDLDAIVADAVAWARTAARTATRAAVS